jgi:predicted phage terminase large subunit-like protein
MTPQEKREKLYALPPDGEDLVWGPWKGAQAEFLACDAYEALYGGAAGGGKSDCLLAEGLRYAADPHFRGIFFRRTFPELEAEIIPRTLDLFTRVRGLEGAKYNRQTKRWIFPGGGRFSFAHLEHEDTILKHRSAEYCYVAFDELTTFTKKQYLGILQRLRSAHGLPCRVRAGTNPGGPGHDWVFQRWRPWLDPTYEVPGWKALGLSGPRPGPGEPLWYLTNPETGEDIWVPRGTPGALSRCFHPAKLEDNPALGGATGAYAATLQNQDPLTRKQMREGDWLAKPSAKMFFDRAWAVVVKKGPAKALRVRFWDRAGTEVSTKNKEPDWTVGVRLAFVEEEHLVYVEDMVRLRGSPGVVKRTIRETAERDGVGVEVALSLDPGQAGLFEGEEYLKELAGFVVSLHRETGDKLSRFRAFSAQAQPRPGQAHGFLRVVEGPWNEVLFSELEGIPEGPFDDIGDSIAGGWRVLAAGGGCEGDGAAAELADLPRWRGASSFDRADDNDSNGWRGLPRRRA